jgi:hypothetical protein
MGQCYEREKVAGTKPDQNDLQQRLNTKFLEYESKRTYQVEGESPEDLLVSSAASMRLLDRKTRTITRGRVKRVAEKHSNVLKEIVAREIKKEI